MKQLRQYIRQILLTEAAYTTKDLPGDLLVKITDSGALFDIELVNKSNQEPSGYNLKGLSKIDGTIRAYRDRDGDGYGNCLGAYMVSYSEASDGWGPFLYDIAIEFATIKGNGLIADRNTVSEDAEWIWRYYMTRRNDVSSMQMDTLDNDLTPEDEDNCNQHVSSLTDGQNGWQDSPLSKMYKKPPTTIEKLRSLGKLVEL